MKIVKYIENNEIKYGDLINENDLILNEIISNPFNSLDFEKKKEVIKISKSQMLIPCRPSKIICFAINYEGITNFDYNMVEPLVFLKASNSLCLNNSIVKLGFEQNTWGEAELGVVIRNESKNLSIDNYEDNILGYIVANDISTSNIEGRDHHLARSKSPDGYCPISNYIDTSFKPKTKIIESYQNDILLRKGSTDQMFWSIGKLISWLSSWMTLYPEDIILTGSPSRIRERLYLSKGDSFTCKIEGFSELKTYFE